jgi:hypothetical protein
MLRVDDIFESKVRPVRKRVHTHQFDNEKSSTYSSSWDGLRLATEDPFLRPNRTTTRPTEIAENTVHPPEHDRPTYEMPIATGIFIHRSPLKRFIADHHQEDCHEQHQNRFAAGGCSAKREQRIILS